VLSIYTDVRWDVTGLVQLNNMVSAFTLGKLTQNIIKITSRLTFKTKLLHTLYQPKTYFPFDLYNLRKKHLIDLRGPINTEIYSKDS